MMGECKILERGGDGRGGWSRFHEVLSTREVWGGKCRMPMGGLEVWIEFSLFCFDAFNR